MELASGSPSSTFGAFSVGYGITPGSFTAFSSTQHTDSFLGNSNVQGYYVANPQSVPAAVVNTSSAQTVLTASGILPIEPGQILMHPGALNTANAEGGPIQNSILRFTAPTAGAYTISGAWTQLHFGTTSDQILLNGSALIPATSGNQTFNFSTTLAANDHVDFLVNSSGIIAGDSTGLRATLTTPFAISDPNSVPVPGTLYLMILALSMVWFSMRHKKIASAVEHA